tara:strand:- start:278 stop:391 length:114 start_codon:yes stop_codon:yes gene_type:complete
MTIAIVLCVAVIAVFFVAACLVYIEKNIDVHEMDTQL